MQGTPETRLRAAKAVHFIETHPGSHDQDAWYWVPGDKRTGTYSQWRDVPKSEDEFTCGTTMCAAGTVIWQEEGPEGLSKFDEGPHVGWQHAADLLGITYADADQLFYNTNNEQALYVLRRIAAGKKDIFKGMPEDD